jgi:uncharacterized membrane protein YhhN
MPRRALIEKRPLLLASFVAAVAFYLLRLSEVPGLWLIVLKGAAVALLAAYALLHRAGADERYLAGMMAIAAVGDVAMEIAVGVGAFVFFLYHVTAISLYLRHPREHGTPTPKATAAAMLVLTPLLFWLFPADRAVAWPAALYGLALGGMAACAWMSAFPRYRVGVGAALFLVADLLLAAGMGPLTGAALPDALVWPLYYGGQFLITIGVIQTLRKRHDDVVTVV